MSRPTRRPSGTRLACLEQAHQKKARPEEPRAMAEEEWLERFRRLHEEGLYAEEPEAGPAILAMARAIEEARGRADPPFLPPPEFLPGREDAVRRGQWRSGKKYPGLDEPFDTLLHCTERSLRKKRELAHVQ